MRHRGGPLLLDQKRDARQRMSMARGQLAEDAGGIVETAKPRGERANRG